MPRLSVREESCPTSDGETFALHMSELLIAPELYALLGSPDGIAPGDFLGRIRVDANSSRIDAVPEPSTGLLAFLGGALLVSSVVVVERGKAEPYCAIVSGSPLGKISLTAVSFFSFIQRSRAVFIGSKIWGLALPTLVSQWGSFFKS